MLKKIIALALIVAFSSVMVACESQADRDRKAADKRMSQHHQKEVKSTSPGFSSVF